VLANVGEGGKPDATPMDYQATEKPVLPNKVDMFCNVFELWQQVKDNLSLPLLTCMCEKAGLQLPASLLLLPMELKIKVLENHGLDCIDAVVVAQRHLSTLGLGF
jgi:hypothetical protein